MRVAESLLQVGVSSANFDTGKSGGIIGGMSLGSA